MVHLLGEPEIIGLYNKMTSFFIEEKAVLMVFSKMLPFFAFDLSKKL